MSTDEDTAQYIKPNIEIELSKEKRTICRQMVQEIKTFGVNQRQILFLVQLLALELENREAMKRIVDAVGGIRDENLVKTTTDAPRLYIPKDND